MLFESSEPSSELRTRTTYKLLRPIESAVLLIQAVNLAGSAFTDNYRPGSADILYLLAGAHFVLAVLTIRHQRGPLTRGPGWTAAWIAMMFLMQPLIAFLLKPGDYANFGFGVPAGNYTLVPLATFAFYPWGNFRNPRTRRAKELTLVCAVIAEPILIIGLMHHWSYTDLHLKSFAMHGVWAVTWYLLGKGFARVCMIAISVESEALMMSHKKALNDLHSHIDTASMGMNSGRPTEEVYQDLREILYQSRRVLLLEGGDVSLEPMFKNVIRRFGTALTVKHQPALGGVTLPRDTATDLERVLADLLKNVVMHGGGVADVEYSVNDSIIYLTVRDFGEGPDTSLSAEAFASASQLQELKRDMQVKGGNLTLLAGTNPGTALLLTLPIST